MVYGYHHTFESQVNCQHFVRDCDVLSVCERCELETHYVSSNSSEFANARRLDGGSGAVR